MTAACQTPSPRWEAHHNAPFKRQLLSEAGTPTLGDGECITVTALKDSLPPIPHKVEITTETLELSKTNSSLI